MIEKESNTSFDQVLFGEQAFVTVRIVVQQQTSLTETISHMRYHSHKVPLAETNKSMNYQ